METRVTLNCYIEMTARSAGPSVQSLYRVDYNMILWKLLEFKQSMYKMSKVFEEN